MLSELVEESQCARFKASEGSCEVRSFAEVVGLKSISRMPMSSSTIPSIVPVFAILRLYTFTTHTRKTLLFVIGAR